MVRIMCLPRHFLLISHSTVNNVVAHLASSRLMSLLLCLASIGLLVLHAL